MRAGDDINDVIVKLLESFLENYEREENILRNGSNFVFECIELTQSHSIKLKRGSSYIPSPDWIQKKKATINPKNTKNNYCFANAIIAALHHQDINHNSERISNLTPYISNYNWNNINFPAEHKDWNQIIMATFIVETAYIHIVQIMLSKDMNDYAKSMNIAN